MSLPPDDGVARVPRREALEGDAVVTPTASVSARFEGKIRTAAGGALFASVAAWGRFGRMEPAHAPLLDFWEKLGLPGRTAPRRHVLTFPLLTGVEGWTHGPEDYATFREVWICPEEYAVAAFHHLRAAAARDGRTGEYWQANVARVVHRDVDLDGSDLTLSVIAYGVSSSRATWSFSESGRLRRSAPDPAVVAIATALAGDSHQFHRAAEPDLRNAEEFDFRLRRD